MTVKGQSNPTSFKSFPYYAAAPTGEAIAVTYPAVLPKYVEIR